MWWPCISWHFDNGNLLWRSKDSNGAVKFTVKVDLRIYSDPSTVHCPQWVCLCVQKCGWFAAQTGYFEWQNCINFAMKSSWTSQKMIACAQVNIKKQVPHAHHVGFVCLQIGDGPLASALSYSLLSTLIWTFRIWNQNLKIFYISAAGFF